MTDSKIYTARIAGQDWPGVAPNEWKRGVVTVRLRSYTINGLTGEGFLVTAPGISAWAPTADAAVSKMADRARRALKAVSGGR